MINKAPLISALLLCACANTVAPAPSPEPMPVALPETVSAEAEPIIEPAQVEVLIGLSPRDVIARMGPPDLVRRDGLSQVMLFEHGTCVFDVVFYAETIESPYEVAHISARTRSGQKSDKTKCLQAIKPLGFDK